jgi:hypothetical protein
MTNAGFTQQYIPLLVFVLLFNDCNLPTPVLSKCFDASQRFTVSRVKHGEITTFELDVKKAFHHNVKLLLKYCEVMMSPETFEHIFGFQSVKGMNQSMKGRYYSSINSFLRGVTKF